MGELINKLKNMFGKKEQSTAEMFDEMNKTLQEADEHAGGFFPKEDVLSADEVHSETLKVEVGCDFEQVYNSYKELKKEYNPEQYKDDEEKYKEYVELDARLDFSYAYFKNKFGIN